MWKNELGRCQALLVLVRITPTSVISAPERWHTHPHLQVLASGVVTYIRLPACILWVQIHELNISC